jgi:hypothetical protein
MKFEAFIEKQYLPYYGYVWYWEICSLDSKTRPEDGLCNTKRQAKRAIRRVAERIKYEQNRTSEKWKFEL